MKNTQKLTPVDRLKDRPRIMRALRKATAQAMLRHKRAGVPVATWKDGKVAWIAPEDIQIDEAALAAEFDD